MEQITADHTQRAIFAAESKARHRLVRLAGAAGLALLASWLIALALGMLGGFDSLPGLSGPHSKGSSATGSRTEASRPSNLRAKQPQVQVPPRARHAPTPVRPSAKAPPSAAPTQTRSQTSNPKTKAVPDGATLPEGATVPSTSPAPSSTSNGRGQGTTRTTTGKPIGSPGNGQGGSGAPGQLP
jgi:hypothetical protein